MNAKMINKEMITVHIVDKRLEWIYTKLETQLSDTYGVKYWQFFQLIK